MFRKPTKRNRLDYNFGIFLRGKSQEISKLRFFHLTTSAGFVRDKKNVVEIFEFKILKK